MGKPLPQDRENPQWGRELWEPIRGAVQQQGLPVYRLVVVHEPGCVNQAWELVLQQPADLVHLRKPRLPAMVLGLLYKLLWRAAVLVDIDDEELLSVGEREPIKLDDQGHLKVCPARPWRRRPRPGCSKGQPIRDARDPCSRR